MDRKLIAIAVGVALAGATGGYALGGFATGGTQEATTRSQWWSSEASAADSASVPVETGKVAMNDGPKQYSCRGCGPTLAERRAEASYAPEQVDVDVKDFGSEALTPIPSYRPAPMEGGTVGDPAEARHPAN